MKTTMGIGEPASGGFRRRVRTGAILVLLVAVALAARLYRLDQQAAWSDEYFSLAHLAAPNLQISLLCNRMYNREHMPLYFILEYFWAWAIGASPIRVRLLSVLVGVCSVPLVYLLGRDTLGRKAGLIAGACLALSPVHIFYAQSLRPYSFVAVCGVFSAYTLLQCRRTGRPAWWVANFGSNLLLAWFHTFGVVLIFAQGCFLLLTCLRRLRTVVLWTAAHFVALLPNLYWIATAGPPSPNEFFTTPGVWDLLVDLFGDDGVGLNRELRASGATWSFLPSGAARVVLGLHPWCNYALVCVFVLTVLWGSWKLARSSEGSRRVSAGAESGGVAAPDRDGLLWLLILGVLPPLTMAAISYTYKPCIMPRYTLYSSFGLYILLGGAIASLARRSARGLGWATLGAIYACQLSLTLPAATRTEWFSAASRIRANASPSDIILVGRTYGPAIPQIDIFRLHMGPTSLPILPAHTLQAVCDRSACFLHSGNGSAASVWAVIQRRYSSGPLPDLERCFDALGLTYDRQDYPAMEGLTLYRIARGPRSDGSGRTAPALVNTRVDYTRALAEYGISFDDAQRQAEATAVLRRCLDEQPAQPDADTCSFMSWSAFDEGDSDLSARLTRRALALDADHLMATWTQGMTLLEQGDNERACAAFSRVLSLGDSFFREIYAPLLNALCARDYARAAGEAARVHAMSLHMPPQVMVVTGLRPVPEPCLP